MVIKVERGLFNSSKTVRLSKTSINNVQITTDGLKVFSEFCKVGSISQ